MSNSDNDTMYSCDTTDISLDFNTIDTIDLGPLTNIATSGTYSYTVDATTPSITIGGNYSSWNIDEVITAQPSLTIGKYTLNEETIEKILTVLDIFENLDNTDELKAIFDTTRTLRKIRDGSTKSD